MTQLSYTMTRKNNHTHLATLVDRIWDRNNFQHITQVLPGGKIVPVSPETFVELLYECVFEPFPHRASLRVTDDNPVQALEVLVRRLLSVEREGLELGEKHGKWRVVDRWWGWGAPCAGTFTLSSL